jgi:phosphatidylglycerol:prolipoprotein diacylglycerol transferase
MMPVVFRIPFVNIDVPGYGLAMMLGFLLSVVWAVRRATKSGANPDVVLNCAFIALIGGVGGSRIMYVVHYWEQFAHRGNWLAVALAVIDVRKGGLEVYGGFIAASLGVLVYMIFWRHSFRWYLDILAPSAALGMGLGRIGCFLNGCCWGLPSDLPWAVRFPFGSNASIEQWYAGQLDMPKELIWMPPNRAFPDGRPAALLPREMLRMTDADFAKIKPALDKIVREDAALIVRRQQATSAAERADIDKQASRLRAELLALAPTLGRGCAGGPAYAEVLMAMQSSGLSLAQLQELAHQHPSLPVHPTQLYSTITLVLLALLLSALYWRRTRDGQVICTMLLIEPWTRYILETIRADNPVDTFHFTISQFLALLISLIGLAGLIALQYAKPRSPRAKLWEPPPSDACATGKGKRQPVKA